MAVFNRTGFSLWDNTALAVLSKNVSTLDRLTNVAQGKMRNRGKENCVLYIVCLLLKSCIHGLKPGDIPFSHISVL